jgi:hypothetical protein
LPNRGLGDKCAWLRRPDWIVAAFLGLAAGAPIAAAAREYVAFVAGVAVPVGQTTHFADSGESFGMCWRHYNRGRTAFEVQLGYSDSPLSGDVQEEVDQAETLVREKNQLAQEQGGPGDGFLIAEFGSLEITHLDFNFRFRVDERWRLSPVLSIGAGVYHWRQPLRLKFYDVPSFGEANAYDPISPGQTYEFIFGEQDADFTKEETDGGLNIGLGVDTHLSRHWNIEVEGRGTMIFSSGKGNPELEFDDQSYLDTMTFLQLQGGLVYRF